MNIILSMAVSANGMIATADGSEDFLSHENWNRFVSLANRVGCFLWGRKTYEAVSKWDKSYLVPLENVTKLVLSSSQITVAEGFTVVHSPDEAISHAEDLGLTEMIVTGGATINTEFAKRDLMDEVILDINPSIIGNGIPLFATDDFEMNLKLVSTETLSEGIVEVRYEVVK